MIRRNRVKYTDKKGENGDLIRRNRENIRTKKFSVLICIMLQYPLYMFQNHHIVHSIIKHIRDMEGREQGKTEKRKPQVYVIDNWD